MNEAERLVATSLKRVLFGDDLASAIEADAQAVRRMFPTAEEFTVEDGVRELAALERDGKLTRFSARMTLRRVAEYARRQGYVDGKAGQ